MKKIKLKTLCIYDRERYEEQDNEVKSPFDPKKPQNFPKKAGF